MLKKKKIILFLVKLKIHDFHPLYSAAGKKKKLKTGKTKKWKIKNKKNIIFHQTFTNRMGNFCFLNSKRRWIGWSYSMPNSVLYMTVWENWNMFVFNVFFKYCSTFDIQKFLHNLQNNFCFYTLCLELLFMFLKIYLFDWIENMCVQGALYTFMRWQTEWSYNYFTSHCYSLILLATEVQCCKYIHRRQCRMHCQWHF